MILKLLVILYSWAWNVQTWKPTNSQGWGAVIAISVILDPFALIGLVYIVERIVDFIIERRAK